MDFYELIASLPERVELVGGPYCGAVLFPQHELITDVLALETNSAPSTRNLPHNFEPRSPTEILFAGPIMIARYVMESDGKWSFRGEVEVQMVG